MRFYSSRVQRTKAYHDDYGDNPARKSAPTCCRTIHLISVSDYIQTNAQGKAMGIRPITQGEHHGHDIHQQGRKLLTMI
eukprot:5017486-Pleurochrysis_carterae.AAC.3